MPIALSHHKLGEVTTDIRHSPPGQETTPTV